MNTNIEEFNLVYKQIYNENLKEKLDKIEKRKKIEGYDKLKSVKNILEYI